MNPLDLIALVLRSLAGAATLSDVFGSKASRLAPILSTLAAIAEVPAETRAEQEALRALVQRWVDEGRGPTDEELDAFARARDELDARLRAARDSIPAKGGTVAGMLAACALALGMLFAAPPAEAAGDTANLSWTHATTMKDKSPIPATAVRATLIEWRRPGASGAPAGSVLVPYPATSTAVQSLTCGEWQFVAYTVLDATNLSEPTSPVMYPTGIVCAPNPPGGLQVS